MALNSLQHKPCPSILVFDSGIGGLSVGAAILRELPSVQLVYLADNAALPYGNKSEQALIERVDHVVIPVIGRYRPDLIVVACNTASTYILPYLRAATDIPVIGVVPAIKPAAQYSVSRRIGLLATKATVHRRYTDQLIADFASDCHVTKVGSEQLVCMAEQYVRGQAVDRAALLSILEPFIADEVDVIVLGCTHFPILAAEIAACLPSSICLMDSGIAIATRVRYLLNERGICSSNDRLLPDSASHVLLFSGEVESSKEFRAFLATLGMQNVTIQHADAPVFLGH